jgi:RNA polymerase sigma-54 factor
MAALQSEDGEQMALKSVSVVGRTSGLLLEMRIRQTYLNNTDEIIEAVYTFPLAWGAILLGMEVELGGKKLVGTVIGREKATRDYEEAIAEGDTPVMLQKSKNGLFTVNLGNLKPSEEANIEFRYAQLLRFEQGNVRITVPTTIAPRYGDAETQGGLEPHESADTSLLAEYPFHAQISLGDELSHGVVESPTHAIKVGRADGGLSIELSRKGYLDRDFVLNIGGLVGKSIAIAARDTVEGSLTTVIASFCPEVVGTPASTEIKILVDCSGSMAGDSIESAKKALHQVLAVLAPEDRFSLSRFGTGVEHTFPRPRKATAAAIKRASEIIAEMDGNLGGTEIEAALTSTFRLGESAAVSNVLLITDGEVWSIDAVVEAATHSGHRIFAVGVGSSPAETLLRELAERTGGACELVSPNEDIEQAIIRTFRRIRGAVTATIEVSWGVKPVWSLPAPRAIHAGDTVHVFAAFESGAAITPALRIDADGSATLTEARITGESSPDFLPRVAAYQRLRHIPEDERQSLALKYQLVTANTSLFLMHERAAGEKATDMPRLQRAAQMMAAGWGGSSSVAGQSASLRIQSLDCRLGQHLTITPQLQQAIRLQQLSTIELQQVVQNILDTNPLLEEIEDREGEPDREESSADGGVDDDDSPASDSAESGDGADSDNAPVTESEASDEDWENTFDTPSSSADRPERGDAGPDIDGRNSSPITLRDHLTWQMQLTTFSQRDRAIAASIIDCINEDGYLTVSMDDLLAALNEANGDAGFEMDEVEAVLRQIQNFDPLGVGSRSLAECLLLKMRPMDPETPFLTDARSLATEENLCLLAARDFRELRRNLKIKPEDLQGAMDLIHSLNPRPGGTVAASQATYIAPDVVVRKVRGVWRADLNTTTTPRLRINAYYERLLRQTNGSTDTEYIQDRLKEARWFIKSLNSRNDTLLKVARTIVDRQRGFFNHGPEAMRPLVLHDVATTVEMHESTISRVTANKYIQTPRGIFELKYFFSSHVGTSDGGTCSATAIREIIKKLVDAEVGTQPISDSGIADLLAKQGIHVARQTVAKYRESMSIPPSSQRKSLS